MATVMLAIADLRRDELQTRAALSEETVSDYKEAMDAGRAEFPPVVVFKDNLRKRLYLADGFHRVEAMLRRGDKRVKADVRAGTYADALKFALGANANHGLRRTNADKRHAVEMAWTHRRELWPRKDNADPSASVLADACGVSMRTVQSFMATIQPTQIAQVEPPKKPAAPVRPSAPIRAKAPPTPPTRNVFGMDGKTRCVPVPPTVTITPSVPVKSAPPVPAPKARPGYYIAKDGKEHAIGVVLDRYGVEVPKRIENAFAPENALTNIVSMLQSARRLLAGALEAKDAAVAAVSQRAAMEMDNAYNELKAAKAHCVCRMCQGEGCKACQSAGFQTKMQYDRNEKQFKAEE